MKVFVIVSIHNFISLVSNCDYKCSCFKFCVVEVALNNQLYTIYVDIYRPQWHRIWFYITPMMVGSSCKVFLHNST